MERKIRYKDLSFAMKVAMIGAWCGFVWLVLFAYVGIMTTVFTAVMWIVGY